MEYLASQFGQCEGCGCLGAWASVAAAVSALTGLGALTAAAFLMARGKSFEIDLRFIRYDEKKGT
jgi:hypothetical protein